MRRAPGAVRGGIARDRHSMLFGGLARRRRVPVLLAVALVAAAAMTLLVVRPADARPALDAPASRALGRPWDGRLVRGMQLAPEGFNWFTWDPVRERAPNRDERRWATDRLLETLWNVLADYRDADRAAPRVGIADLSRRHGGPFGQRFGGLGHRSHRNGLDADVLYPRVDERERRPVRPGQVDRIRAQALVDGFVTAGASKVFVGPSLGLRGPRDVVVPLVHHDDHLHVRIN